MEIATTPRRRKTKSGGTIYVLPYKQATPTGFGMQADNREPYMSPLKMRVMTSRSRRFHVRMLSELRVFQKLAIGRD